MLFEEQIDTEPNLYPWTQEFIDKFWASFWTPNEFNFKTDVQDFKTHMSEPKKRMVVKTLSAIGQVEVAVKSFWGLLGQRFRHPSLAGLGFVMANTEEIHNQAYKKLLEVLGLKHVFEENRKNTPALQGRVSYLRKYLQKTFEDDRRQSVYALILFTLFVENVSLFSQFYVILHENMFHNTLKDTAQQVQYTKNEETLHAQIGIKLIKTLRDEYPELFDKDLRLKIEQEVLAALVAEDSIIDWMLDGVEEEEHLSKEILKNFVRKRIRDSLVQIGYSDILITTDPDLTEKAFWFDEVLLGNSMTDFFNGKPIEYSKSGQVFDAEDLF